VLYAGKLFFKGFDDFGRYDLLFLRHNRFHFHFIENTAADELIQIIPGKPHTVANAAAL
jgi:hypothetical protein